MRHCHVKQAENIFGLPEGIFWLVLELTDAHFAVLDKKNALTCQRFVVRLMSVYPMIADELLTLAIRRDGPTADLAAEYTSSHLQPLIPSKHLGSVSVKPATGQYLTPGANPAKVEDFCDKDLLQVIDLVRFLFGKLIPTCREAH